MAKPSLNVDQLVSSKDASKKFGEIRKKAQESARKRKKAQESARKRKKAQEVSQFVMDNGSGWSSP
ncbi:hypothetical protein [Cohnella silvisoli]|uniref:Uncharacterized protein n=1 Tax=Cohnella silvisoli TaxID=2873699 RepID=A0ABV1KRB7_9BACL|nr:hypothetical protein [Cohnella silvisoli]MCD9021737.1 hypothetical protein [Cohnella silvisoli]